jgi:hypothetical protein
MLAEPGRALAEAGQRARGLRKLERAEEELAACGAEGYRRQAIRELRRLGRRVTHQPAARNLALSLQESRRSPSW